MPHAAQSYQPQFVLPLLQTYTRVLYASQSYCSRQFIFSFFFLYMFGQTFCFSHFKNKFSIGHGQQLDKNEKYKINKIVHTKIIEHCK